MASIQPFYEEHGIALYQGDCLEVCVDRLRQGVLFAGSL